VNKTACCFAGASHVALYGVSLRPATAFLHKHLPLPGTQRNRGVPETVRAGPEGPGKLTKPKHIS
jgi:hypothetical protein